MQTSLFLFSFNTEVSLSRKEDGELLGEFISVKCVCGFVSSITLTQKLND